MSFVYRSFQRYKKHSDIQSIYLLNFIGNAPVSFPDQSDATHLARFPIMTIIILQLTVRSFLGQFDKFVFNRII
uniref:Uncharacterized protein n=1 Tax=Candidatus Kentrum sp. FM TaxID=2126340 RepID=A0A450TW91_9GAMM|nr:MAG: hypothetical protein BECKFM1743A_GA0114220_107031 [Candidatus Kentron sp. FM]VFK19523.1 MAG: hypothetical protein BECKFM1743B_GA0114221_106262 [Candidatus Kentron sp. FM]